MSTLQVALSCIALFAILALLSEDTDDDQGPGGGLMQPAYPQNS